MKKAQSQKIYMRQLRGEGYDIDSVLDLLKEGSLSAKGRYNPDYTRDLDHPDPHERGSLGKVSTISNEAWQDYKFDKKKFFLENEGDYALYDNIYIDRKKLDVAVQGIKTGAGAPRKYDEDRFYQELIIYVYENGLPDTSHEKWCEELLTTLPYLKEFSEQKEEDVCEDREDMKFDVPSGPSVDWVRRKTKLVWNHLKSTENS